jgi:LL-diaminopimelate aminotransferase
MTVLGSIFKPADRIAAFKPYFFVSLNQKIAALRAKKIDVIRIDMGSPDLPPASFIVDALERSARRPDTHGYSPNGGTPALRQAAADYYKKRFGVDLDPQKEVLGLLGSKEGLFNLSQVALNPGDVSLIPDPGYPVYTASSRIAGAEVVFLPLLAENGFLPDLDAIPADVLKRARLLWLNYPNNPTGAVADLAFMRKAVEFGRKHNIVIAHDNPYADICFDGYMAPSILQIEGAKDVAVEFNSLSKTYNMAGWRVGLALGNPEIINWLNTYKSQMDSSQFTPILEASVTALSGDQSWIEERNQIYQYRRDICLGSLRSAGFTVQTPPAAIYVWARLPGRFTDSLSFCERLLEETGVSTTPGVVYGEHGEGYLRISLGTATDRIKLAMQRLADWTTNA